MLQHALHVVEPPAPMPGHDGYPRQLDAAEAALTTVADPSPENRVSRPNADAAAVAVIAHARRVLAPLGTVAVYWAASVADALPQQAGRPLLHGLNPARVFDHARDALIRASSSTLDVLGMLLPGMIRADDEAAGLLRLSLAT